MWEKNRFLPYLVAVGVALAPLPAFAVAEKQDGFSLENLSIGLEFNYLNKGLDATTAISGTGRLPGVGTFTSEVENSVDRVKLTEVLARVNYQVNDHFTPYLLLGTSGLAFDDRYRLNLDSLRSVDTNVPYSDSFSLGYGIGAEGVLMELPAEMKLTYGVRMFTFKSSDSAAVPPQEISSFLTQINPVEKVDFSTDATYREWDVSFGVSREFELGDGFSVTPQLGYRHSSISLKTSTDVEYSPGVPYYLQGTFDRSLGGSLSSVTLGVTGGYLDYLVATLVLAVGDETGITLAVTYGF